jgi:hypothetical protein
MRDQSQGDSALQPNGCEERATLGNRPKNRPTPTGLSLVCARPQVLSYLLAIALLLGTLGCRSSNTDAKVFHPWGREDARDAKRHLDGYKHVLLVCVYDSNWEDRGPNEKTPHHFKATVVRSYKGDWKISEQIAFVDWVDAPAPANSAHAHGGNLMFVFTNDHTSTEIGLDTGELGRYDAEYAPALDRIYPP